MCFSEIRPCQRSVLARYYLVKGVGRLVIGDLNLNSEFPQELVEDPLIIDKMRKRVGFNNSQQFQVRW